MRAGEPHKSTTELTEDGGVITVRAGSCVLTAKPEGILMEATAEDADSLLAVQDAVARHLVRFGTQEELVVTWSEAQV